MTYSPIFPGLTKSQDLEALAHLEWQAAVYLGFPHDLSEEDRAYQQRCFARAEDYHQRALEAAAKGE